MKAEPRAKIILRTFKKLHLPLNSNVLICLLTNAILIENVITTGGLLLTLSKINKILFQRPLTFFFFLYWFPKLISFCNDMSNISNNIPFILNPLLFRSVRARWCVQRLDRCLWSSQSVALVNLDVMFQEQDEDVAGGPGPITINLVRGHLWNLNCSQVSMWSRALQLCERQFHSKGSAQSSSEAFLLPSPLFRLSHSSSDCSDSTVIQCNLISLTHWE